MQNESKTLPTEDEIETIRSALRESTVVSQEGTRFEREIIEIEKNHYLESERRTDRILYVDQDGGRGYSDDSQIAYLVKNGWEIEG